MQIEVLSNGIEVTDKLRDHIDTRVRLALSRFSDRVRRVRVRLTDINGPRGGEDIQCKIQARFAPGGGELVVDELRSDPFVAVARASTRVSRSIARRLRRVKARARGRS